MKDFDHPPLKRHESLQPFSRDHFVGLRAAHRLILAADGSPADAIEANNYFVQCWNAEIASHFNEEEELLMPLMTAPEMDQMRLEHAALRHAAQQAILWTTASPPPAQWCRETGTALHDHIRWEERVLFMAIQNRASPEALAAIGVVTAEIEKSRPGLRKR